MKILLIYPFCAEARLHAEDAGVVPIGLYYVGAMLKASGYDVEILNWHDMRRTPERIPEILKEKRPDVIGFSILNANRWSGIDIARVAKQMDPSVTVVFGGIGATCLWRHFLTHFPEIDFVVLGEGEITFLELLRALEKKDTVAAQKISGIAFRKKGKPVSVKPRELFADLDRIPDPARYFTFRHLALTRGCPSNCTFCGSPGFWGRKVRSHSPTYFVNQMEALYRKGVTFFYVSDDTFTLRNDRVIDICREILKRGMKLTWAAISRVDAVDDTVLKWMRRAGCVQISYGVESGSKQHRRMLNKHITDGQIKRAFALTTRWGIMARAYFIYGCPGETRETIQETMDLIDAIRPLGAIFYILTLFPGTALYEEYQKRAGVTDDIWLERIEDILYFETDPEVTRDQVLAFGHALRRHFYSRLPQYAAAVELAEDKAFFPLHADFLSRLAMTFDHGDYAHIGAISGKQRTAEQLYQRALSYHRDPRAILGLGILAQKRGDYESSIRTLSEGVSLFPDDPQLHICLAVSHMNLGRFEKALELLLRFEMSKETWHFIAGCYRAMGNPDKAAEFSARMKSAV